MTFREFLEGNGLKPRAIMADGRWRRCPTERHPKKLNGAYKLAPDGVLGWAQDWSIQTAPVVWRPDKESLPSFDPAALHRANMEAKRRAMRETEAAAGAARAFYEACKPLIGTHPYLASHGLDVTGCYGLRVDPDGWLVVPALLGRRVASVQRISPDGDKRFWPGASVKGASYTIERRSASLTILCEGLATGLALYAAVPSSRVVVSFNAGNLSRVQIPPSGLLTIAADNDWETEGRSGTNPGVKAAQEASSAFGGGVAVPGGIRGTDWCDYRAEKLAERLARKLPHQPESQLRRAVDAEIADAVLRAAKFRVPALARA